MGLFRFQDGPTIRGRAVFDQLLAQSDREGWATLPLGECVGRVGLALVGTPYVGGTLERADGKEVCTLNLEGLDCVTLFETSLDFARMLAKRGRSPEELAACIEETRYRGGRRAGNLSRLHYTLDWFGDNARKGIVRILTPSLPGAEPWDKKLSFMSDHPASYPALRHSDLEALRHIEREASGHGFWIVPVDAVKGIEDSLQTGDIVGWATSVKGLDIAHTGLILRDEKGPRFLHASSRAGKVVLDARVSECGTGKNIIGFVAARPLAV